MAEYLDEAGLQEVWSKARDAFALANHTHSGSSSISTILYNNSSGSARATLSQAASDFKFLVIHTNDCSGISNISGMTHWFRYYEGTSTVFRQTSTVSGFSVTVGVTSQYLDTSDLKITKVIGIS